MKSIPSQLARFIIALAPALLPADVRAQCVAPPAGLVSWWRAEGDGTDRADANHGAVGGGLGFAAGQVGQAFNFTADGQVVTVPAAASLDVGAGPGMTVEGWINPAQATTQLPLVEWNSGAGPGAHFWTSVSFAGFGGPGSLYASLHGGVNGIFATGPGVIQAGVWQHVAMTYDPASGLARLYRNGAQVTSTNLGAQTPLTTANLNFGARPGGPFFRGRLDEFAVYSRALSAGEILALYNGGSAGKCLLPATFTVTSLADSGPGSLRALLSQSVSGDTIGFAVNGIITLTSGELVINKSLNILGPDPRSLAISGAGARRVFNLTAGTVTIAGLTIQDGLVRGATPGSSASGGGILNFGTLLVSNCFLLGNLTVGADGINGTAGSIAGAPGGASFGGGIWNNGSLTIVRSAFRGNGAQGGNGGNGIANSPFGGVGGDGGLARGGAVYNSGTLTVVNCTFTGNLLYGASGGTGGAGSSGPLSGSGGTGGLAEGGAVFNDGAGTSRFVHATIFNNLVQGGPGGNSGSAAPQRSPAGFSVGGGLFSVTANTYALNTLVAGNQIVSGHAQSKGPDVSGAFTSQGHNLIGATNDSTGWTGTDLVGSVAAPRNPLLGPFADNGGPTPTSAPQPNSPAVDAGDDATLSPPHALATDQRGFARREGSHVDIGAVELSVARLARVSYPRPWLLTNVPGSDTFLAEATVVANPPATGGAQFMVTVTYELRDETNGLVALRSNSVSQVITPSGGGSVSVSMSLPLAPVAPVDPVNHSYWVNARLAHRIGAGPLVTDNAEIGPTNRFLYFNGRLLFGPRVLHIVGFGQPPQAGTPEPPTQVNVTLRQTRIVSPHVPELDFTHPLMGGLSGVQLRPNGDAVYTSAGFIDVTIPTVPPGVVANVGFLRTSFHFQSNGISANFLTVKLPTGFGYTLGGVNGPIGRVLQSSFISPNVMLDDFLRPLEDRIPAPGGSYYFCEETKPLLFPADGITWHMREGRFEFTPNDTPLHVRTPEYNALAALTDQVADNDSLNKKSNDRYYESAQQPATVSVRAGPNREAWLSTDITLNGGTRLAPHFPYAVQHQNPAGLGFSGSLVISNDLVVGGDVSGGPTTLEYLQKCGTKNCFGFEVQDGSFSFYPANAAQRYAFTADGGWWSDVTLPTASALGWGIIAPGEFAQATTPALTAGSYHMPGTFLRGDQTAEPMENRPGVLLYTGFGKPGDPRYVERYGTRNYETNGAANYAGLNFRAAVTPGLMGISRLAGQGPVQYPLRANSKYYARYGGVSGVHEPQPNSITALRLYGYDFTFSSFGVAYLDNNVVPELSRINGSVRVLGPSDFTQSFAGLTLTCNGALDSAEIPATGSVLQPLKYWQGKFRPLAMDFASAEANLCDPSKRFLVLGVETYAAHVPQPLLGSLGFKPTGHLVTLADTEMPYAGSLVDSRLEMPANLTLNGPSGQKYGFTTVGRAYLNNAEASGAPPTGFINFAGKLDVPFFAAMPVHIQTAANTNDTNATFHLMGGWPARQGNIANHGWDDGAGLHFFNTPPTGPTVFDQNNRGFPAGVALDTYRNNPDPGAQFHPRAQQSWIDVVDFDFPLQWDSALRIFTAFQPQSTELPLVTVDGQVRRMDALAADVTFGTEFSALPKINLGNLALSAVDSAFPGVSRALDKALADVAGSATGLLDGVAGLDRLMNSRLDGWLTEALNDPSNPLLDNIANGLYAELTGTGGGAEFVAASDSGNVVSNWVQNILQERLNALADIPAVGQVGNIIHDITNTLGQVDRTLETIYKIVSRDANGQRRVAYRLTEELVNEEAAAWAGALAEKPLNAALDQAGPTFDDIVSRVADVRGYIGQVFLRLRQGQEFQAELFNTISGKAGGITQGLEDDINGYLKNLPSNVGPGGPGAGLGGPVPLEIPEAEFKALVKRQIAERLAGSGLGAAVQVSIKQRLQDVTGTIRQTIDSTFQQINHVARDALSGAITDLAGDSDFQKFAGKLSSGGAAAKIQGYAHLNGNTLEKLRLDGRFELSIPDTMRFDAYVEFAQRESKSMPEGCRVEGLRATEIAFGADNVQLEWIFKDVRASVGTKITLAADGPEGFAGYFEVKAGKQGGIKLGVVEMKELAAVIAFGEREGYFGARARAKLNAFEVAGGIWFGKACDLKPLQIIDPEVAEVVPRSDSTSTAVSYAGAYAYAEGWVPVNQWIGIPSTCLLNIRAGVGAGVFYFESGTPKVRTFGGKILLGADAELLCIAHARLTIRLLGASSGGDLVLRGRGDASLELGACPFCIELSKSVGLTYEQGGWDVDF